MRARVVEGVDGVGLAAGDQDRLVPDGVLEEIPHLGDFLLPAGHLPHPWPQALHLEIEEALGDIAFLGDDVFRRGLDQLPVAGNRHDH